VTTTVARPGSISWPFPMSVCTETLSVPYTRPAECTVISDMERRSLRRGLALSSETHRHMTAIRIQVQWWIQDLQMGAKVERRRHEYRGAEGAEGVECGKGSGEGAGYLKLSNSSHSECHFCSLATYCTSKKHCFWPPFGAWPPCPLDPPLD